MGVTTNCYLVYGVQIKGTPIQVLYGGEFEPDDDGSKYYIQENVLDKYNAVCITKPYGGDWTVLGIEIFSGNNKKEFIEKMLSVNKKEFIENIQTGDEKFNQLINETGINLDELKLFGDDSHPQFIMDSYLD